MKGLTEIDGFKEKHDVDPAEISTAVQVLLHQPIVMDAWTSFAVEGTSSLISEPASLSHAKAPYRHEETSVDPCCCTFLTPRKSMHP